MNKKYFYELDWMRAIAIILVLITHASFNEEFNVSKIVAYSDIFSHLSVPIFLFISGFLIYGQKGNKIVSKFPRIVVPYLIFSVFCQIVKFRVDILGNIPTIIYNLLTGDSFGIYYFVFIILYLYLFAILLNKYKKYIGILFLISLIISIPYFVYSTIPGNSLYYVSRELYYRFPLNWISYFIFGMWLSSLPDLKNIVKYRYFYLLGFIISLVGLVVGTELGYWPFYGSIFQLIPSMFGILTLFSFLQGVNPPKSISYLSKTSFSIYLLHIIPLAFFYYFVPLTNQFIHTYSLAFATAIFVFILIFSLIARELFVKIFKSNSKLIVGS